MGTLIIQLTCFIICGFKAQSAENKTPTTVKGIQEHTTNSSLIHEDQDILVNWTSHPEIMKIQKTNHFIFIYDGTVLVNPEYVLVAKKLT